MSKESLYTQEVTLPTRGLLNSEVPGGKLTQRIMTVADKKYLAGTKVDGEKLIQGLVSRCTVSPAGLDASNLVQSDIFFLLLKLRILSYGENYSYKTKCPECGERITVKIKLSEIEVHELEDDFEKSLSVVLPHKGDKVFTRILTAGDAEEVSKQVKRHKKRFPDMEGEPGVTMRLAHMITRIELQEENTAGDTELTDPVDILKYVEELTDYDATAIESTVGNLKVGIDPVLDYDCPECDEMIEVGVAFNAEFFRPKYDSKS